MPSDLSEPPKRNIYDQWVLDAFGVDPSTYPPSPAANAAIQAPAPSQTVPDADLPARRALAGKMAASGNKATPADLALVADHAAAALPLADLKKLNAAGITFCVTRGDVATQRPSMAKQKPRDFPGGATWKGTPGTFFQSTKQIVIATQDGPNGSRVMPGLVQSSSADVLAHETGHALNRLPMFSNDSDSDKFEAAYSQPMTGRLTEDYYHQLPKSAGRDEAFAESYAMFLTRPAELKADSPALYNYWHTREAH